MIEAIRSVLSPPVGFTHNQNSYTKMVTPNLQVLAAAAYSLLKYRVITKRKIPKTKVRIVYEVYTPDNVNQRWFCQFVKNINDETFLGRWCLENSTNILDRKYPRPVVFEWCTEM